MSDVQEEDVKEAIREILLDKASYTRSLNYAVNYCRAALEMSGEELRTQCLYILNNIIGWRAPKAKEVRMVLKEFTKLKKKPRRPKW